uniref:Crossover junction endodeoxyribonuclease RuvC n=1 Tax=candidate division WOR-3 bacterium TaxID=2052148 RepID=A0A7C4GD33_UNCW3
MRTSTSRATSLSACPGPGRSLRVLGIDPGLSASGYGIVEGRVAVGFGVIVTRAGFPPEERLRELADGLDRVVRRFRPDVCAMEAMFFKGGGARSVILAAQSRGALLSVLGRRGVRVTELTPATVKLAVTGSGRASKSQLGYMIRALLRLDGRVPEHAADALAAAWCLARRMPRR